MPQKTSLYIFNCFYINTGKHKDQKTFLAQDSNLYLHIKSYSKYFKRLIHKTVTYVNKIYHKSLLQAKDQILK